MLRKITAEFYTSGVGGKLSDPSGTLPPITAAIAMGKDAQEFLEAAKLVAGRPHPIRILMRPLKPMYLLLCHSIELSLKSYLHARGYDDKKLKGLWHRLENLIAAAEKEGLVLSDEFKEMAMWLAPYHSDNAFRYHKQRMLTLPLASEVIPRLEPQIHETHAIVDRMVRESLRPKAGA